MATNLINPVFPNQTGAAPYYGVRAWANFDGTAPSTRASGNIASVTYNAVGDYTIAFTTPMPDANYAIAVTVGGTAADCRVRSYEDQTARTASLFRIIVVDQALAPVNVAQINVTVTR